MYGGSKKLAGFVSTCRQDFAGFRQKIAHDRCRFSLIELAIETHYGSIEPLISCYAWVRGVSLLWTEVQARHVARGWTWSVARA